MGFPRGIHSFHFFLSLFVEIGEFFIKQVSSALALKDSMKDMKNISLFDFGTYSDIK